MDNCIFCKIIKGEVPSSKVFEDDDLFVINDIRPKAPVHMLIMPKAHVENLDGVTNDNSEILAKIMLRAKELAKENGISGAYKVTTNIGEMAGQTVFHMHFHLIGGWGSKDDVVSELNVK